MIFVNERKERLCTPVAHEDMQPLFLQQRRKNSTNSMAANALLTGERRLLRRNTNLSVQKAQIAVLTRSGTRPADDLTSHRSTRRPRWQIRGIPSPHSYLASMLVRLYFDLIQTAALATAVNDGQKGSGLHRHVL